ncbi:SEC31B [Scenedesmus sp. PABB004]|nr:SEC31B [Scenedesmus sp. PABB004]
MASGASLMQIDRSATVAFAPGGPFLAAGTVAGAIDMSFSTSSVLEVFGLDFAASDAGPSLAGSVPVQERFHRLAWGAKPSEASGLGWGILAGGLADGSICLWNPAAIIEGQGGSALLSKMQKHTGAVKGLEFNGFSLNLLASGAADGELCIWDVAAPAQPSLYPALKGPAAGAAAGAAPEITYISWNRKVQHILASTQVDGATVVWDLKKQRPVITLKDPNSQRRCSVLQWNPDVATQLVVASDDDRSPTLQMWDLRNSMSPVKEFVGHTKGVLGMSWCQQDHSLLLSCSKDNRTICWDVNTTDVVCEMPSQDNWSFDVQWSPTVPGVFSTSTFDGKVSLCNVLSCTSGSSVETFNADFSVSTALGARRRRGRPQQQQLCGAAAPAPRRAAPDGAAAAAGDVKPLKKAPTWLRRPAGVCFGFGGRLVSFANHKQQVTDPMSGQVRPVDTGTISVTQVVTEHELVAHSEAFESAVAGRDRAALQVLAPRRRWPLACPCAGRPAPPRRPRRARADAAPPPRRRRHARQEFCAGKAAAAAGLGAGEEAETWTFMGVLFEDDARRQLLAKLGFSEALLAGAGGAGAPADGGAPGGGPARKSSVGLAEQQLTSAMEQLGVGDGARAELARARPGRARRRAHCAAAARRPAPPRAAGCGAAGKPVIEVPGGEDFFNQADDPHGFFDSLPDQPSGDHGAAAAAAVAAGGGLAGTSSLGGGGGSMGAAGLSNGGASEPATPMGDPNHVPEGAEREDDIQKAIFVGNYEGAVDTCLKVGRLADALLIANIGGGELFKKTMARYMRRNPRPYMAVISAMVDGDYMSLVKTRPVGQWRETLAVLATYTGADQWAGLCDALASRLGQTGMLHAASLCYICAGNVDQAVSYWSRAVRGGGGVEALQGVIEKSVVLGLATNTATASPSLADLVTTYASTLATQGRLGAALRYLDMVPGEASTSVAVLRDRIFRSGAPSLPADAAAPPFPFQAEDIRPAVDQGAAAQAAAAQQQYAGYGAPAAAAANPYTAGGYGAAGAAPQQQAGGYGQQAGYGAPAATQGAGGYGAAAAGGYGQAAGGGGYGAAPQQAGGYGQQAGYGAPAAAQGAGGYGAAAAGGYGQAAGGGYGAAAGGGYGGYGAAPQQPAAAVYQPKRGGAVPAPPPPQPSLTPAAPAAAGPPGGAVPVPGAFTPAPVAPGSGGMGGAQTTVAPRAAFTPTASATVAQPPPAAAAGYGAPGMAPPPVAGPHGSMAPGGMLGGAPGSGSYAPAGMAGGMGGGMVGGLAPPPAHAAPPPPPPGPPAHISMATADVSKVPADQRGVLGSLGNLFNACMPLANTPARKREMDDNSRRIGGLFWRLNEGQVAPHVVAKLQAMCAALDAGNWPAAQHIQIELTASDWDECGVWLTALKRLIKIRQSMG